MGSNEYLYDLEVWHRRTKEMIREAEEARLAKRLRAMRRKGKRRGRMSDRGKDVVLRASTEHKSNDRRDRIHDK